MTTRLHLVKCDDYNGHKGVLFAMRDDDSRLGNGNYHSLGLLRRVKGEKVRDHRGTGLVFECADGVRYVRWFDWSVGRIN